MVHQKIISLVPRDGGGGRRMGEIAVGPGYKLSVIRRIRSKDLMHNTVTIVDNTVLYN